MCFTKVFVSLIYLLLLLSFGKGDRDGLEALYLATNGSDWLNSANWIDPSTSVCDWYGVVCSLEEEIVSLSLPANNLQGELPDDFFLNLTALTILDLQENFLVGFISSAIGNLSKIEELKLRDNAFLEGFIPTEIGMLTNLTILDLSRNFLSFTIPSEFGLLTNLQVLDLFQNQLSSIPTEIGNLANLLDLNLGNNDIGGALPTEMGLLSKLQTMTLFHNSLEGDIPTEFGQLTKLQTLNVEHNSLNGTIPSEMALMTDLEHLLLSRNALGGTLPTEFGTMTNLRSIYLFDSDVGGEIPTELGSIATLETLFINAHLTGTIPTELAMLPELRDLDLSSNLLTGSIPTEFGLFEVLRSLRLQQLDFSGSGIPSELGKIDTLQRIDLAASNLSGTLPTELGDLVDLGSIIVWQNSISGTIPTELALVPGLRTLIVGENPLGGIIPTELGTLTELQQIQIGYTDISGTLPTEIGEIPNFHFFAASFSQLSGPLPEWICDVSTDLQGLTFDCPLPSCCDELGKSCGNVCPPPSPSPTPSPSPYSTPSPSPSPLGVCPMDLISMSSPVASLPMVFVAETSCGSGRYVWSYVESGSDPIFLCNGTNPRASCSGSSIETFPNAFSANSTVTIRVEFILEGSEGESELFPFASRTVSFPASQTTAFLFYGSTDDSILLEATFENNNFYNDNEFRWSCVPQDADSCPYCPSDDNTEGIVFYSSGPVPNFTIAFEDDFDNDCTYDVGVSINFFPSGHFVGAQREALILSTGGVPVIRFDDVTSSCLAEDSNGEPYLALSPVVGLPEGFSVLDYLWQQTSGNKLSCDSSTQNCGGDGNPFLYFSSENVEPCEVYAYEVAVIIGNEDNEPVASTTLPLCEMTFLAAPTGGTCFVETDSDSDSDCNAVPLSTAVIRCQGWEAKCYGESSDLTVQVFRVSESGTGSLVPLDSRSTDFTNEFFVTNQDMEVKVRVCNAGVCTTTDSILIRVCEESVEDRDETIENILDEVADEIKADNLEKALQKLLVIGDSLDECEDYFDELIQLTNEYVAASVASVAGNVTNLVDTTVLMELLATIGARSCATPTDLFESLLLLCEAPTTADVQTFALDELLEAILDNVESDNDKIEALDFAIRINECVQARTLSDRCSDRLPTLFEGESFYFAQYIFTMEQFRKGEVSIDIPNATIFFPEGFDQQIARDYTLDTGDEVIRFSCVAINMVRTDGILSTGVSIDSAIIGMTAMVFVNGSAVTIDLGHNGEPVRDVILRIYRQAQRGERRGEGRAGERPASGLSFSPSQRRKEREEMRNKEHHEHSTRRTLVDDCDEEVSCSYYEGEGLLSTAGCETVDVTDEYVDCACDHYSNFGLLFSTCDTEEWTLWRILSVSLLGSFWLILLALFGLILGSRKFRRWSGLETRVERNRRVLGARSKNPTRIENEV